MPLFVTTINYKRLRLGCVDVDILPIFVPFDVPNTTLTRGKKRIIAALANVRARVKFCAALTHKNASSFNKFAAKSLDA